MIDPAEAASVPMSRPKTRPAAIVSSEPGRKSTVATA
jgi:hypothetical protein